MTKRTTGTAPSKLRTPTKGIDTKAKPFPSGIEAGSAIAECHASYLAVAGRMRATIGSAYNAADGFPQWAKLDAAMTSAAIKMTRADIQKGFAARFDTMYGTSGKAAIATDAAKVKRTQALAKAVGFSAIEFRHLSPQAKAALGKENPKKATAVQDFSDMLNKFDSACWNGMLAADNRANGRVSRKGKDDTKPVVDRIKACRLGDVPALVAKLVEERIEVTADIKALAERIILLKLANIKPA